MFIIHSPLDSQTKCAPFSDRNSHLTGFSSVRYLAIEIRGLSPAVLFSPVSAIFSHHSVAYSPTLGMLRENERSDEAWAMGRLA